MADVVDTTVLTDALLKRSSVGDPARAALAASKDCQLPIYAIKEFKAGPLHVFVYVHNKFLTLRNLSEVVNALHGLVMSPRKYFPATFVEALREAIRLSTTRSPTLGALTKKYGAAAEIESVLADEYRLQLRLLISKAWASRKKLAPTVTLIGPLPCYVEVAPKELASGLIDDLPRRCDLSNGCCLGLAFRARKSDVVKLIAALPNDAKRETSQRRQALKQLRNGRDLSEKECKALGDAVFVLQAPPNSTILTTNIRDHEPLAKALDHDVRRP